MKLLFITPCLANGGAEHVVARLASALADRHEIHVACTWPEGNARGMYPIDSRVRISELHAQFPVRPRTPSMAYRLEHRSMAQQLRQLKREIGVDVSISVLTPCNYDNVKSCVGEPTIVSIRNILEPTLGDERISAAAMRRIITRSGKRADAVVCVAKNVADEQTAVFGVPAGKTRVIYNPVDSAELGRDALLPTGDSEFESFRAAHEQIVVTVGRFAPQKGHRHLLRAFAASLEARPAAGLVLLGRGSLEEELRGLAADLGISEHVYFAGFSPTPAAYLARSDLFVMSSQREGFSNALLEACACGLPIVSTDCNSGPRELLAPSTDSHQQTHGIELADYGMLVPVCDNAEGAHEPLDHAERVLADAITRMLSDDELRARYARQSRERARQFDIASIVAQWEELIEVLVAKRVRR